MPFEVNRESRLSRLSRQAQELSQDQQRASKLAGLKVAIPQNRFTMQYSNKTEAMTPMEIRGSSVHNLNPQAIVNENERKGISQTPLIGNKKNNLKRMPIKRNLKQLIDQ